MKRTKLILGLLGMLGLLIATGSFSIAGSTGVFSDDKEIRSHEALSQEPKLLTFQVLSDLHIEKGDKKVTGCCGMLWKIIINMCRTAS
ncbi:hypothetical protein [Paenibacillus larvae]|uniref:hypothetical protein n=1 Tax=Paenibacillus larvae TaxID=1464 RepID=UPI002890D5BC|nr:hypothetical protein [Paenibacillus larvae]MDT2192897.1 hypothetical protein [Paenibacillus larvae]MDT2236133.1 hypothetical protein [Paenibacillus larvae]MDT2240195.1 hypothetical protein [Paenibacillus larvae]MDT2256423.1 hypothetical protein [Paenibacillus larvae]MDT2258787.1 hypothetical protein [Paenibacillus larvae]